MRYDSRTTELLLAAGRQARGLGHSYVGTAHLLLALSQETGWLGLLMRREGIEPGRLLGVMRECFGIGTPDLPLPQGLSSGAAHILKQSAVEAMALGSRLVEPGHVLLALLRRQNTRAQILLCLCGSDPDWLFTKTLEYLSAGIGEPAKRNKEGSPTK